MNVTILISDWGGFSSAIFNLFSVIVYFVNSHLYMGNIIEKLYAGKKSSVHQDVKDFNGVTKFELSDKFCHLKQSICSTLCCCKKKEDGIEEHE